MDATWYVGDAASSSLCNGASYPDWNTQTEPTTPFFAAWSSDPAPSYRPQFDDSVSTWIRDRARASSQAPPTGLSTDVSIDPATSNSDAATSDGPPGIHSTLPLPPSLISQRFAPYSLVGSKRKAGDLSTGTRGAIDTTGGRMVVKFRIPPIRRETLDERRARRLAGLGVIPEKPELVGWGAGSASVQQRVEYFSRMSAPDRLSVLSFCDQLKPNLLIDVLVSISNRHPSLQMFGAPDWAARLAGPIVNMPTHPPSSRPVPVPVPNTDVDGGPPVRKEESDPSAMRKIKQEAASDAPSSRPSPPDQLQIPPPPPPAQIPRQPSSPPTATDDAATPAASPSEDVLPVDETLPAGWPGANRGMYALLPPEKDATATVADWMVDERDDLAFVHFFIDSVGRQILTPLDMAFPGRTGAIQDVFSVA